MEHFTSQKILIFKHYHKLIINYQTYILTLQNHGDLMSGPWVEKYRPQSLDDIVGQEHIIN